MLTAELRRDIDKKWEACWPVNTLRPLVLIDCISYVLFLKKLEEDKLIAGTQAASKNKIPFYINDDTELYWSYFKDIEAKNIHILFSKENGITDLLKNYSHTSLPYSNFLKASPLINPSAVLLHNVVEIVKIIGSQDSPGSGEIFEYLLHKEEIETSTGQLYAPIDAIDSIISLVQPHEDEMIFDPACGNGHLLLSVAAYMSAKRLGKNTGSFFKNLAGADDDPVQLRIAAMNMILHGIENPNLLDAEIFKTSDAPVTSEPALVISNLYFTNIEKKLSDEPSSSSVVETGRKDINLLKNILKKLANGGRAAIIIRDYILYNNLPEVKEIRQQLLDGYAIDAVINLPDKPGSAFSGACLLLFHLPTKGNSDNVWFYKMKPALNIRNATLSREATELAVADQDPLSKNKKVNVESETSAGGKAILSESFFVPLDEIKGNNHILAYNFYKRNAATSPSIVAKNIDSGSGELLLKPIITGKFVVIKRKVNIKECVVDLKKKLNVEYFLIEINKKLKIKNFYIDLKKRLSTKDILVNIKKKTSVKHFRIGKPVINGLLIVLIFGICILGPFFINKSKAPAGRLPGIKAVFPLKTNGVKGSAGLANRNRKRILTPEQIKAIIEDTSGIINFNDESAKENDSAFDYSDSHIKKINNRKTNNNEAQQLLNLTATSFPRPKYTVIDTAYFHNKPNSTSARKVYLDPLKKNILTALQDSNGFIYIIYTNKIGITSKGWIDKKYLRKMQ